MKNKMNKSQIIWIGSLVSGLMILISTFTPMFVAKGYSSANTSLIGDATALGIFVLIIAGVALLCSWLKKYIPSLVMGCLAALVFLIIAVADDIVKSSGGRYFYSNGIAFWLLLLGFLGLITFSILGIVDNSNRKKAMMYGQGNPYGNNQQYAPNAGYQGQYAPGGQPQYNQMPQAQNIQYTSPQQQYAPPVQSNQYTAPQQQYTPTSQSNQYASPQQYTPPVYNDGGNTQYAPAGNYESTTDPSMGGPRRRRRQPAPEETNSGNEWQ